MMKVNLCKPSTHSGYTHCTCRDCMDVTVSTDTSKPELCEACQEAGCVAIAPYNERIQYCSAYECQREDAYGECDGNKIMTEFKVGMRVQDVNPDRAADRAHDPASATGTVVHVEWEDELSPTIHVRWDNSSAPDVHGVMDVAPL